jgi:peptidoglycan/xylan/chitin deacetylase (PgdA/CDA1 family)
MRHAARELISGRTVPAGSDIQEVALTCDDGPNDPYTQQLLDLLARYQVRATFFLIGSFVRRRPEIVRAIRQFGYKNGGRVPLSTQPPKRVLFYLLWFLRCRIALGPESPIQLLFLVAYRHARLLRSTSQPQTVGDGRG